MRTKHWLAAAAGTIALGLTAMTAQAAPVAGTQDAARAASAGSSAIQNVFWWGHRRRYYRPYVYGAPYFYFGPQRYHRYHHHRRYWRHRRHW